MFGKPSSRTRKHLETDGLRATATVLAISDRGMAMTSGNGDLVSNTEVILKTRLSVQPEGAPAFEVEKRFRYPQLSVPKVGTPLSVRYDPDDHDEIMIEDRAPVIDAPGLPGGKMDLGAMLDTIKATKASNPGDRMAMADALKQQMGLDTMVMSPMAAMAAMPGMSPDPVGQLERLAALHSSGALTDAEFAAEKAKLLAQ